jgi:hypothetical protein
VFEVRTSADVILLEVSDAVYRRFHFQPHRCFGDFEARQINGSAVPSIIFRPCILDAVSDLIADGIPC